MSSALPSLPGGLRPLHQRLLESFSAEAALMRGYGYWVPGAVRLEDKTAASLLLYLHMRNADQLHRLIGFLRLPVPARVYSEEARALTVKVQRFPSFTALCAGLQAQGGLEHHQRLQEAVAGSSWVFDYYILEAVRDIRRRYEEEILPTLTRSAQPGGWRCEVLDAVRSPP